jgi:adenylate kinase family enzyme
LLTVAARTRIVGMGHPPPTSAQMSVGGWLRIHVIGIPGSGKSTLATACAEPLGVTAVDLDYLPLEQPDETQLMGPPRYDAALAAATAIAQQDSWVTEGIYCGWTAPLLERADVIIWLDTPPLICVWRIVLRHARRSLAHDNDFPGLRLLARFAWGVLRDSAKPVATTAQLRADMNHNSRATTAAHLEPWRAKVIRARTRRHRAALGDLLADISASG